MRRPLKATGSLRSRNSRRFFLRPFNGPPQFPLSDLGARRTHSHTIYDLEIVFRFIQITRNAATAPNLHNSDGEIVQWIHAAFTMTAPPARFTSHGARQTFPTNSTCLCSRRNGSRLQSVWHRALAICRPAKAALSPRSNFSALHKRPRPSNPFELTPIYLPAAAANA